MTSNRPLYVVILAAGKGTRMRSKEPKVLHKLAGRTMIHYVLDQAQAAGATQSLVVVGPDMDGVARAVEPHSTAVQHEQKGTGHAVMVALKQLGTLPKDADLLVLYGDGPLYTPDTIQALVAARRQAGAADLIWLGFRPTDPSGYGRLVTGAGSLVEKIVEEKDVSAEEKDIHLCWSGLVIGRAAVFADLIGKIDNKNAKSEYYLTALVAIARAQGLKSGVLETSQNEEVLGVNSRAELAVAEVILQQRLRAVAMNQGATLVDPTTVWFSWDTILGQDVMVQPSVWFGPGVVVGDGVEIKAFSHLEGCQVGPGAVIGPYARLRPGTVVGEKARVGNFVEVKNATLAAGAKANHLTYLGDAMVGADANIGAGTITCNYDGAAKHRTEIGAGAFIGSNSALVAPVTVGKGAIIAAGSTITQDVPDDSLAIARARQVNKQDQAAKIRAKRAKKKD